MTACGDNRCSVDHEAYRDWVRLHPNGQPFTATPPPTETPQSALALLGLLIAMTIGAAGLALVVWVWLVWMLTLVPGPQ